MAEIEKRHHDLSRPAVRPQYQWADRKIRVHTFAAWCLLALLRGRVIEI